MIIPLPLLLIVAAACNFGCSSGNISASSSHLSNLRSATQLESRTELMRTILNRESSKLNLKALREVHFDPADSEIRVWVGFGLYVPRCFVLRRVHDLNQAYLVTSQDSNAKLSPLAAPQSGWPAFDQLLKDHKINSPIELKLDDEHLADPDEEVIAVEVKSGERYDLVYYPVGTQTEDGKKVITVCKTIEKDFGIRMGCEQH